MDEIQEFFDRNATEIRVGIDVALWREQVAEMQNIRSERLHIRMAEKRLAIEKQIEDAFCAHFGLQRHKSVRTFKEEYLAETMRSKLFSDRDFDHCTYYRKPVDGSYSYVIVSQPYGYDAERVTKEAVSVGAAFFPIEKWGWYYPGRANCFMLVFPRVVVQKIRSDGQYLKRHGMSREARKAYRDSIKVLLAGKA
jgi:hypothetical protein